MVTNNSLTPDFLGHRMATRYITCTVGRWNPQSIIEQTSVGRNYKENELRCLIDVTSNSSFVPSDGDWPLRTEQWGCHFKHLSPLTFVLKVEKSRREIQIFLLLRSLYKCLLRLVKSPRLLTTGGLFLARHLCDYLRQRTSGRSSWIKPYPNSANLRVFHLRRKLVCYPLSSSFLSPQIC